MQNATEPLASCPPAGRAAVNPGVALAARCATINPQPMFKILAAAAELEETGRRVIHLEIGDTHGFNNQKLLDLLKANLKPGALGYCPSAGEPRLREAVAALYSAEHRGLFSRKNVAVSPANALITQVLAVLCDPGDAVLMPDPGFPTYRLGADMNGLRAAYYKLHEKRGWAPDLGEIENLVKTTPRVKAIIVNSPSNPLGSAWSQPDMDGIVALAEDYGIANIFDDCYIHLNYARQLARPAPSPNNVFIYSLSKEAAVPGLRIGCAIGDERIIAKIADYNSLFFSCQPRFIQLAAAEYLEATGGIMAAMREQLPQRIARVAAILAQAPHLTFVRPEAAFYFFINVGQVCADGEKFALDLLHRRGVCVCPGGHFGPSARPYIRVSLGGGEAAIYEGCREIAEFSRQLKAG